VLDGMLPVRTHYKKIVGILWVVTFSFLLLFLMRYLSVHDMTFREWLLMAREDMKEVLMDNMIVAPLIYIIIYILRPLVFFPTSILTPLSSAVFGPFLGWIYTYIGENIAASVAFFVARYLGGDVVSRFKRLERIDTELQEHGLRTVIFLRLVPLFPFDAVNFGLGLTAVSWRQYALGTAIGVIPGLTAYIFLGASLLSGMYIIPTILGFLLLSLLASLLRKRNKAVIKKLI
jgi:uncharacterized membrane protein YdjX (TVP38/TMEM64 family)